eukprot:2806666-Rhodomonas_salina.3
MDFHLVDMLFLHGILSRCISSRAFSTFLSRALKCYQTAARVAEGSSKALPLYNVGAMLLRAEDLPRAHGGETFQTISRFTLAVSKSIHASQIPPS